MIKKQFLLYVCFIFLVSFCFPEDYTETVFKDVFPETSPTYQFDVRNPLLKNELYVTDISVLENRILRTTLDGYSILKDGTKVYDDSDIRTIAYRYYIFDKSGQITDKYIIVVEDNGLTFNNKHKIYKCDGKTYTDGDVSYVIKKDGKSVILFNNEKPAYEFSQNRIVQYQQHGNSVERQEYACTGDSATCTDWWDKRISAVRDYQYGILIKDYRPIPDGEFVRLFTSAEGTGLRQTSETRSGKKKAYPDQYTERRRNAAGFLEYELVRPVKDGSPGDYSISKAEIIDGPDEILQKYFQLK
jgi:hypothetical protein